MGAFASKWAWSSTSLFPKAVTSCDPPRPPGPAASLAHFGPYHTLGNTHAAIRDWCAANGHHLAGPNWEVYGHWQADWDANPSRIRTDVFYLLAQP
jgi:hypothetical protein